MLVGLREKLLSVLTSFLDPKHFGTDPDPEFNIRVIRFRILTCFQNVCKCVNVIF